jgi:hypothetical protein
MKKRAKNLMLKPFLLLANDQIPQLSFQRKNVDNLNLYN